MLICFLFPSQAPRGAVFAVAWSMSIIHVHDLKHCPTLFALPYPIPTHPSRQETAANSANSTRVSSKALHPPASKHKSSPSLPSMKAMAWKAMRMRITTMKTMTRMGRWMMGRVRSIRRRRCDERVVTEYGKKCT